MMSIKLYISAMQCYKQTSTVFPLQIISTRPNRTKPKHIKCMYVLRMHINNIYWSSTNTEQDRKKNEFSYFFWKALLVSQVSTPQIHPTHETRPISFYSTFSKVFHIRIFRLSSHPSSQRLRPISSVIDIYFSREDLKKTVIENRIIVYVSINRLARFM